MSNMKNWKNIVQSANLKESDSEDANYTDHEVSMAKSQLLSSVKSSTRIAKHLSDKSEDEGLPGWVASKLTVAEDYLQAVADYMDGEDLQEGYKVMPPMSDKYIARDGLEGPFSTLSGKVVYYDPKEGSYYDPDTDMYISYDEFQQYDNDYSSMKDDHDEVEEGNEFSGALADAKKSGKKEFEVGGKTYKIKEAENDIRYGIVRYPDTAISYIKNDGDGWEHIYDRSYGFKGPVAKADLKHAKKIAKEKIPSRMINEWVCGDCSAEPCQCNITEGIPKDTTYGVVVDGVYIAKGNKANMRKLAKEKDGQLMNAPGKKVGDKTASVNESTEMMTEAQFDEAAGEKDACYRKVKSRYKVWPSAYASGALSKCRKVGASNWGNSKK